MLLPTSLCQGGGCDWGTTGYCLGMELVGRRSWWDEGREGNTAQTGDRT